MVDYRDTEDNVLRVRRTETNKTLEVWSGPFDGDEGDEDCGFGRYFWLGRDEAAALVAQIQSWLNETSV